MVYNVQLSNSNNCKTLETPVNEVSVFKATKKPLIFELRPFSRIMHNRVFWSILMSEK